jgi:LysR family transcriptional activator of glutamate synthase operon
MELRQLRSFAVLAEEQHFTRAAARLHVAQPALSQQISTLERQLGTTLVDRTTRRVTLTHAGQTLLVYARRMLTDEAAALAELDELAGLRRGHLTIGAAQAMGPVDLVTLLAAFHRDHPAVELTVREALTVDLTAAVLRDELDMAFVTGVADEDVPPPLDSLTLASEELVCVTAPGHRLARRARLPLERLREETFIMFTGDATIRRQVEQAALRAGFVPSVGFETNDVTRIRGLAAAGLGVAIIPASDARAPGPAVAVASLTDPGLRLSLSLCRRRERRPSPAAQALLDASRRAYAATR